jgi:hypothetical protein
MGPERAIDAFFARLRVALSSEIGPPDQGSPRHWIVLEDDIGTTVCELDRDTGHMAVAEVLGSHVDSGARSAAFVTVRGSMVMADALVAEPRDSDTRQADLRPAAGRIELGPWQGLIG